MISYDREREASGRRRSGGAEERRMKWKGLDE